MKNLLVVFFQLITFTIAFGQNSDSLSINNAFKYETKKLSVPAGMMVSGLIFNGNGKESLKSEIVEERNEHLFGFDNHIDDYAQFAPFLAIYGFELAGMKPRTDVKNRTAILIKGQILNLGLVYILKKSIKQTRPDGTSLSFPSGHTANAFAGATMLSIEYGQRYKWVPYASYGIATGVGVMRMVNNKHFISDVLFGAGLGILSIKAAYWTHQYKWNNPKSDKDPLVSLYQINTVQ